MSPPPARPSGGVSTALLSPRWSAITLAAMLWGLTLVAHLLFTLSLNTHPLFLVFPFIWATHGLILTWPLHEAVRRTEGLRGGWRWALAGLAVVLIAGLQALVDSQISEWVIRNLMPRGVGAALLVRTSSGEINAGLHISLMIYFWVYGCYAVAAGLLSSQRRLIEAQGAAQRAELAALRLQLHPHFLFNALNSVSALIVTGRLAEADSMAMNLAAFLRASLLVDQAAPVTLNEEIEAVQAYLDVERVRFGDRLHVGMDIPDDLHEVRMPAFLLQPLIENAIKHAVSPAARQVAISISARRTDDRMILTVSDDGPGGLPPTVGTGTGLRNIRERLAAMYGPAGSLIAGAGREGYTATLSFPIGPGMPSSDRSFDWPRLIKTSRRRKPVSELIHLSGL